MATYKYTSIRKINQAKVGGNNEYYFEINSTITTDMGKIINCFDFKKESIPASYTTDQVDVELEVRAKAYLTANYGTLTP